MTFSSSASMDISESLSPRTTEPSRKPVLGAGSVNPKDGKFDPEALLPQVKEYAAALSESFGLSSTEHEILNPEVAFFGEETEYGSPRESTPSTSDSDGIKALQRNTNGETETLDEVRRLGNGSNGNCWLLKRRTDNALRVCKVSKWRPEYSHCKPVEARIFFDFLPPHERVVRMHGLIVHPWTTQIYFDYYDGGDLHDFMLHYFMQGMKFTESFIWHCYQQLAQALAYIHTGYDTVSASFRAPLTGSQWTPIIHADIKPLNVFLKLSADGSFPSLVLGDFGNSKTHPGVEYIGTPSWMPPENPSYSVEGDVWGIGAIIHAMCHQGQPPIRPVPPGWTKTDDNVRRWFLHPAARWQIPLGPDYSRALGECITVGMKKDPVWRPSSPDLLDWVSQDYQKFVTKNGLTHLVARKPPFHQTPETFVHSSPEDEEFTFTEKLGLPLTDFPLPPGHHQHHLPRERSPLVEHLFAANPDYYQDSLLAWHFRPSRPDDLQGQQEWYQDSHGKWLKQSTLVYQKPYQEDVDFPCGPYHPPNWHQTAHSHWYPPLEASDQAKSGDQLPPARNLKISRDMSRDKPSPAKKAKTSRSLSRVQSRPAKKVKPWNHNASRDQHRPAEKFAMTHYPLPRTWYQMDQQIPDQINVPSKDAWPTLSMIEGRCYVQIMRNLGIQAEG